MNIEVPLRTRGEAERLRTAVYRFFEMKARTPEAAPAIAVLDGVGSGRIAFWSHEAADEFQGYWRVFRHEQPAWHGFRDV